MKFKVLIVFVFFVFSLLPGISLAQNKIVVIPLIDDGINCSGTLVGTRWCDNGDGTVTDMTTGLVWLRDAGWGSTRPWRSNTPDDYVDAHQRAGLLENGESVYAGGGQFAPLSDGSALGDWRMPTKAELYNLNYGTEAVTSSNMQAFVRVQDFNYWTSSTNDSVPSLAISKHLGTVWNGIWIISTIKTTNNYVWPVRSAGR